MQCGKCHCHIQFIVPRHLVRYYYVDQFNEWLSFASHLLLVCICLAFYSDANHHYRHHRRGAPNELNIINLWFNHIVVWRPPMTDHIAPRICPTLLLILFSIWIHESHLQQSTQHSYDPIHFGHCRTNWFLSLRGHSACSAIIYFSFSMTEFGMRAGRYEIIRWSARQTTKTTEWSDIRWHWTSTFYDRSLFHRSLWMDDWFVRWTLDFRVMESQPTTYQATFRQVVWSSGRIEKFICAAPNQLINSDSRNPVCFSITVSIFFQNLITLPVIGHAKKIYTVLVLLSIAIRVESEYAN